MRNNLSVFNQEMYTSFSHRLSKTKSIDRTRNENIYIFPLYLTLNYEGYNLY